MATQQLDGSALKFDKQLLFPLNEKGNIFIQDCFDYVEDGDEDGDVEVL